MNVFHLHPHIFYYTNLELNRFSTRNLFFLFSPFILFLSEIELTINFEFSAVIYIKIGEMRTNKK
jgi:hypothetical protein